jgi:enoyl-CoA hydratase/carnithine racemase
VNLGLFCSTPGVALARVVPRKAALAMLLTGDFIPASDALALGLVNRVVPAADLEAETMALAEKIAAKDRRAIESGKRVFYRQVEAPLARAYDIASAAMVENMMAAETQDAIDAFINRPKP